MEYTFIFDGNTNQWLYRARKAEEVVPFVSKIKDTRMSGAVDLYWSLMKDAEGRGIRYVLQDMDPRERHNIMITKPTDFNLMYAAVMMAEDNGGTFFDGIRQLNIEWGYTIIERLRMYNEVYFNQVGGMVSEPDVKSFVHKDSLSFPDWSERDIKVKKWEGGNHYYAYLGTMQVRDGDILKWNSYDEAYKAAKRLL